MRRCLRNRKSTFCGLREIILIIIKYKRKSKTYKIQFMLNFLYRPFCRGSLKIDSIYFACKSRLFYICSVYIFESIILNLDLYCRYTSSMKVMSMIWVNEIIEIYEYLLLLHNTCSTYRKSSYTMKPLQNCIRHCSLPFHTGYLAL